MVARWLALGTVAGAFLIGPFAPVGSAQATNAVGLPVGTTPDPVTVEDLDGNDVELSRYVGRRPVLFEFWATWCEVCEALAPTMEAAYDRYGDRVDFVVMAVGVNQRPRSIRRHLERHPAPFRFLFDARGRATRAYKAPTTAYVVILGADGRVAYTGVGADQDLVTALAQVLGGT
ncbi:MAG: TlpA family protein disulfide reductase [Gemmatimonadota bacterium]|nr:TlpA family protein disulfide reductase [Gemmatimonadota bacterium]